MGNDRRRTPGLTVIEVLIILAILGILLALAAPNLLGYVQRLRFQEGLRTFSESVVQARDTATRGSLAVRLEADGEQVSWFDDAAGLRLGQVRLPHGTELVTPVTVLISGRGLPLNQVEFDLADDRHSGTVWLLPTGAVLR